ncbi:MAG: RNA polymerase sigma factor [Phycisphaerales bacterium]|nr:RNA polymerase sigma factor [Phycisphaerales bacterium]
MTSVPLDGEIFRQMVASAREGDRAAAERLVREHESCVRSAIYAVTGRSDRVDDIAQQVWTRAWERLHTLDNPSRLRPWLYAIARHAAIDDGLVQRRHMRRSVALEDGNALPARDTTPAAVLAKSELQETLLRAVQALPAHYREPFVLRHLEDWSYAEIAEALDLSVDTVETRLTRARRLLREALAGKV